MTDDRAKIAAAAAAVIVATSILKRSRLARLGVAGAAAAFAYGRYAGSRTPVWHDVPPADGP